MQQMRGGGAANHMIVVVAVLAAFVSQICAEIIHYKEHVIYPGHPEYLIIPKYDKDEVPNWSPGDGRSFIDLSKLEVSSACGKKHPTLPSGTDACEVSPFDILMFRAPDDLHWMEYWDNGQYCCTQSLAEEGKCTQSKVGSMLVPSKLSESYLRSAEVSPTMATSLFGEDHISHHQIKETGLYILLMANCDPNSSPVVVDGSIISVDPYGYLPADVFGSLPFYSALFSVYMIIAVTWAILCLVFRQQLIPLQWWISAVLVIGLLETSLLFGHFMDWNTAGVPTVALTVIALMFGVTKRALSRILVTIVSLGYGVVRPSLGDEMHRVLFLGGAYFVLSLVYTLAVNSPSYSKAVNESEYDLLSLVVFLLAIVDTTFYIWIFTSINNLILTLASRKQGVKYLLYKNFRAVLGALLCLTVVWAIYSSIYFLNGSNTATSNWKAKWTVDALWELIYFIILVAIAVLWAPSNNSQRYAYSIELTQLEDDAEYLQAGADTNNDPEEGGDGGNAEGDMDGEYGGRLQDEKDPFQGSGALDPSAAISKKN